MKLKQIFLVLMICVMNSNLEFESLNAQDANYDEAKIPQYELPQILKFNDGSDVTAERWEERRGEMLQLFKDHVYGVMPDPPARIVRPQFDVTRSELIELSVESEEQTDSLVKAQLKEVTLYLGPDKNGPAAKLLIVLPAEQDSAVPVFLGYNFKGNHTTHSSDKISLSSVWKKGKKVAIAEEKTRGQSAGRWPLGLIVSRGYGLVTCYYGDVDPDFDDGFKNGVHSLFPELQNRPDNWTSIGGWAWGLHRIMDYIELDGGIDPKRVALLGHSRLGKTSLWAGATDDRFSVVISNNSGCGGAAIARRRIGETVGRINRVFPHWFCKRHKDYSNNEDAMPVDQHMLISLMAPRPVYVASASADRWADPRGEFLAAMHASEAYRLLGREGVASTEMPGVNKSVGETVGYHVREGKHDVTEFDWIQYLRFAGRNFRY